MLRRPPRSKLLTHAFPTRRSSDPYDGILNGELPYGKNGITLNDPKLLNSLDLTVRHVDLKRWMRTHYPEHRPGFLFSRGERMAHPFITMETDRKSTRLNSSH